VLLWGVAGLLVLPVLAIALKSAFVVGSWNTKRLGVALFGGFTPIALWLQPIYALPVLIVLVLLFTLHQAGYRMARADESTFSYNPKATLAVGSTAIIVFLLWNGIMNVERGLGGELLAVDRLLVTVPMALVISLAIYGAWTIAHRDSEVLRTATEPANAETTGDAIAPALGLLAVAGALVMGVELFHVVDIFGGDYGASTQCSNCTTRRGYCLPCSGGSPSGTSRHDGTHIGSADVSGSPHGPLSF